MVALSDFVLLIYIAIFLFAYVTSCLFVWDWIKKLIKGICIGHIYLSVGITVVGIALHFYIITYARIMFLYGDLCYMKEWYWSVKELLIAFGVFMLMITMIYRMFFEKFIIGKGGLKHLFNPLHVYCRLKDMNFVNGLGKMFIRIYEKLFNLFN